MSLQITFAQPARLTIIHMGNLSILTPIWTHLHLCSMLIIQIRINCGKSSESCSISRRVIHTSQLSVAKTNRRFDGETASSNNLSGSAQLLRTMNIRSIQIYSSIYSPRLSHVKRALRLTLPLFQTTLLLTATVCLMWPSSFGNREATNWFHIPLWLTLMPSFGTKTRNNKWSLCITSYPCTKTMFKQMITGSRNTSIRFLTTFWQLIAHKMWLLTVMSVKRLSSNSMR